MWKYAFGSVLVLSGLSLGAQTTSHVVPFGSRSTEGNWDSYWPWCSASFTCQQVHDATDLRRVLPTPVVSIRGLSFRAGRQGSLPTRQLDVQITLGSTPTRATTVSSTFASNLGSAPTVVLQYTAINLPAVNQPSFPRPQSWFFPFAVPFSYDVHAANLCWEMRARNVTNLSTDAWTDHVASVAIQQSLFGTPCRATGQVTPCTISERELSVPTGLFSHRLERARANSSAILLLGVVASRFPIAGLCSAFEVQPLMSIAGTTDGAGTWDYQTRFGSLLGYPPMSLFTQFAFVDSGLPLGWGLSPASQIRLPDPNYSWLSQIRAATIGGSNGLELAQTGGTGFFQGLVTGFEL